MVGPVLYLEMLLGGRRGRQYIFRWIYGGWLVLQLMGLYWIYQLQVLSSSWTSGRPSSNLTGAFAGSYIELFVVQQLILMLLATPAITAGAITDEKTRGTLQYLFTADLTAWEIIIGKLLGRTAQVSLLALVGLPMVCFIGVFGGLHPVMLLAVVAVTVIPLLALGAASLLASVWSRQTRDAVLGLYAIGSAGFALVWGSHHLSAYLGRIVPPGSPWAWLASSVAVLDGVLRYFNPLYVLEPAWGSEHLRDLAQRILLSTLVWGGMGVICLGLAIWRLRGAYIRQLEGEGKKKKARWWRAVRAPIKLDPIRWKERHVEGIAPLVFLRQVPTWLALLVIFVTTASVSGAILWNALPPDLTLDQLLASLLQPQELMNIFFKMDEAIVTNGFVIQALVTALIASLIVGIRCSGTVSGEREKQTWEALLLTPLETKHLIRGKVSGIMGASYPYLAAYAIPAVGLSLLGGPWAFFWTDLWLAVTWLAMYFVGAAGVWCSVRARTSWRSLLGTLGLSYAGGFVLYVVMSPVMLVLAVVIYIFLVIFDRQYGIGATRAIGGFNEFLVAFFIASCVVLAGVFFGMATFFIADAEKRVADRERTRHWKDEPIRRTRRRRPLAARPR